MNKCLRFRLPSGAGGLPAAMVCAGITKKLRELNIGEYKTKIVRYELKLWFIDEKNIDVFHEKWKPENSWQKPELIYEDYERTN